MIIGHPDNIKKLNGHLPTCQIGDGEPFPIQSMQVVKDVLVPKTRKTGRLLWQKDPFVTYEDSDREWGLSLGFCKEEEEEIVYLFNPAPFSLELDAMFTEFCDHIWTDLVCAMGIPSFLIGGAS